MWILIVIGLAFLGWYLMAPQGEAGEAAAAPEAPPPPSAPAEPATDGTEFASAQADAPAEAAPAEAAPAEAPAESGGGDDDPFKAA
ncbi:MAG: hypothetical protein KAJ31_04360 [Deltaproteobacteria bacterium]|nr:hypothetical protein [Deltaproteobacteria bacterium]MCK5709627.1 hypothetical protein [Deltaproteobacteria bacterium]